MEAIKISKTEFEKRVSSLQESMRKSDIDACFIYGDEYRRENLRYISNVWPIFERGAAVVGQSGEPILLGAPEGEELCREMSAWRDIRLVSDFTCVTVPDEIEYPLAKYTDFKRVASEIGSVRKVKRLGISGLDAMPAAIVGKIVEAFGGAETVDINPILYQMRLIKSESEIACLRKAAEIADKAYKMLMDAAKPGVTELELAGIAVGECMKFGAEFVPFCLVSSGKRVDTIIGRATSKAVENGDMVMAALAVQYEGYIASFGFPFVCGDASEEQKIVISYLTGAFRSTMPKLKANAPMCELVKAVKDYFAEKGLSKYDVYPPLHGCGVSEAESPYPNEKTKGNFIAGMTVNTDISIFGHPYGSNRIEASFVVTEDGYEPLSKLIFELI